MRIVLVGSGTGGHFYPLIAIAESLKEKHGAATDLYFFGPTPYNKTVLEAHQIQFTWCPAGKLRLYRSFKNILDIFVTLFGIVVAFIRLLILYPDVVISKGGYTSVPVVVAAWLLRIPIIVHESDAIAGRANKIGGRFATYVGVAYKEAASFFAEEKVAHVGMPMRRSFFKEVTDPYAVLGIPTDRPVLFITGGSLGAQRINNLILDSLDELLPHYTIVHQVGPEHLDTMTKTAHKLVREENRDRYFIHGTLTGEQMSAAYNAAALIIARAGSGTIFEIALSKTPAILIPIPATVSRDQRANAYAYTRSGAATVLEEQNLTDSMLVSEITHILTNTKEYEAMQAAARTFTNGTAADTLADAAAHIAAAHT